MRSARVTHHARVKRQRRRLPLKALPFLMILLIKTSLFIAPVVFCGLYMLDHGTPHVLWEYEYYGSRDYPHYTSCTYLGLYGPEKTNGGSGCPLIKFLESKPVKVSYPEL